MWDFPWYTSGERAFKSLSQGFSEVVGAQASKMVLKMRCKSFMVYLGTGSVAAGTTATGKFALRGPASYSNIPLSDSGVEEKLKGATEGVTEGRSRRG